jgi:hypothetical protein
VARVGAPRTLQSLLAAMEAQFDAVMAKVGRVG